MDLKKKSPTICREIFGREREKRILLVSSNIIVSLTIREREIERYDKRDKKREEKKTEERRWR